MLQEDRRLPIEKIVNNFLLLFLKSNTIIMPLSNWFLHKFSHERYGYQGKLSTPQGYTLGVMEPTPSPPALRTTRNFVILCPSRSSSSEINKECRAQNHRDYHGQVTVLCLLSFVCMFFVNFFTCTHDWQWEHIKRACLFLSFCGEKLKSNEIKWIMWMSLPILINWLILDTWINKIKTDAHSPRNLDWKGSQ